MDQATKKLLEECSTGCKMAVDSMNQVSRYVTGDQLGPIINTCRQKHELLDKRVSEMLRESGEDPKQPPMAASTFSWITTEVKMKLKPDNSQISKLMMDGCNMGIQSIGEAMNENSCASRESLELAQELVKTEEEFMKELRQFL